MRVALIDPSLFTLPYDAALAGGLAARGHDVSLYARRPGQEDGSPGDVSVRPVFYRLAEASAVKRLPNTLRLALKGVDHAASMAGLRHHLGRARPDIIHFQWLPLPLLDRLFLRGLRRIAPMMLTVHDTDPFNGNPAAGLQRIGTRASWPAFARLIVHTDQGRTRLLEQGVPRGQIAVLPHGLLGTQSAQTPEVGEPDDMRGPITFLLFGKIKPYKGVDLLIEAFAGLPPALRAQARIRVVGKPYMDLAPLHALAARLGVAEHLCLEPHFVADAEIPALFGRGTIATFPYREIEASGVLSLAIAHGRPLLASRVGGFGETVRDGVTGLLVPVGDPQALGEAMGTFLRDRAFAARCAEQVRTLSGQVPSWTEIAERTAALYGAVLRQPS
jgi:glycosyltransferase involved in cell wall biosynthesis